MRWKTITMSVILSMFLSLLIINTTSAVCDSKYLYRYNHNFATYGYGLSYFDFLSSGNQIITCDTAASAICFNNNTDYACYKDNTRKMMHVDTGNASDYLTTDPDLLLWETMNGTIQNVGANSTNDESMYQRIPTSFEGVPYRTIGQYGYANEFIQVPSTSRNAYRYGDVNSLDGLSAITFGAWARYSSSSADVGGTIVSKNDENFNSGWNLRCNGGGAGNFKCTCNIYPGSSKDATTTDNVFQYGVNTYKHIMCVYNGSHISIFINGKLNASTSATGAITANAHDLSIGATVGATAGYQGWNGSIDNVMVFNKSLTNTEIFQMWVSKSVVYDDGNRYNNTADTLDFNITRPSNGSTITRYETTNNTLTTLNISAPSYLNSTWTYSLNGGANISFTPNISNLNVSVLGSNVLEVCARNVVGSSVAVSCVNSTFVTIFDIIVNCTESYSTPAMFFKMYDENTFRKVNASNVEIVITYNDSRYQGINEYNLTYKGVEGFPVCIQGAGPYNIDLLMKYENSSFETRFYILRNYSISGKNESVSLYFLNSSLSSNVYVTVNDPYGFPIEDAIVSFQRYYIGENVYRTVAVIKSDNQGQSIVPLQMSNVWYKYIINVDDANVRVIGPGMITSTSLILSTSQGTSMTYADWDSDISRSCSYQDSSKSIVCTFSNNEGTDCTACLHVNSYNVLSKTEFNTSCLTSSAGTIIINVSTLESFNRTAEYYLTVENAYGDDIIIYQDNYMFDKSASFGEYGIIVAMMLFVLLTCIGAWNPAVSLTFGFIALLLSVAFDFLVISPSAIASILVVFVIFILKVKS